MCFECRFLLYNSLSFKLHEFDAVFAYMETSYNVLSSHKEPLSSESILWWSLSIVAVIVAVEFSGGQDCRLANGTICDLDWILHIAYLFNVQGKCAVIFVQNGLLNE